MDKIKPTNRPSLNERNVANLRAERIKAGAMRIAAGLEANPNTDFSPKDEVKFVIKLATLIQDYPIPEKEASDAKV